MSSSLFFGQRLCLERFKPLGEEKDEIIISGHGHTIEFYSSSQEFHTENPLKFEFELILTLDVFRCTKSLVQRIICLGNGVLFCVGEKECEILLLYHQEGNLFNVNKRHSLYFDDWLVGAKCIDVTGIVLHFATNYIKFLKLDAFLNVQTKCEINFDGRALITCSLLDGDNWESLQIFAGTSLGPIYKFWPAIRGEKIVQKFLGNNGMSFVIRRFQDWLFSVGDDRALRVWTISNNGIQIFEKFGHGARPFALELVVKHKLILTGGVDEYLCIWRWTENIDQKMTDILLEKRIQLCSLGTIQSILQISEDNFNSGFFLDLLIASRKGALVNIHLSNFEFGRSHLKKLKPLFLNIIKPIPHSENITALAFGFSTNNKKHILVSGSFDRKIVCYSLEQNKVLKIHSSVQLHRSSIETIDVLRENCDLNGDIADLNDETLILSGGGRSELLCWQLDLHTKIFELHLIFSSQLQNRDNTDVRILSVHWIFGRKFALTLCSDATLRISKLNFITKSISESSRFQLPSMAMFRAMNLGDAGSDTYCRFLFVVSSSGHLYTFKLLLNSNEPQINSIHDQFLIEKCGLSSISSVISSSSDNFLHYILIGSESGFIHLLTFDLSLRYPHINISENWHASTITALKIWNPSYVLSIVSKSIASVSLDCRLCIGNYILNENKLNCHTQICLSISDPAVLIVLPKSIKSEFETEHHMTSRRNKGFNFIVSGTGIEFIGI